MSDKPSTEAEPASTGGRPVLFDERMKRAFLNHLASGLSNAEACARVGISRQALHLHLARDGAFRDAYCEAKALSVDALIDRADELAEQATHATTAPQVAGLRLAIDHLWRKASRIAPQRWGERPSVAVMVNELVSDADLAKRMAFFEALGEAGEKR